VKVGHRMSNFFKKLNYATSYEAFNQK